MLPGTGYASRVVAPAPRHVVRRSTWRPGCPVADADLAWVRLTFWGFDARRHTGELLVHRDVAQDVARVFGVLHRERFPQEGVGIVRRWDPDAPTTGDGNGTGAFVCRALDRVVVLLPARVRAGIDLNTFQNPYAKGPVVLPELASSYLHRGACGPGWSRPDGPVVRAFARIGWEWGGAWRESRDYMHFSRNGL